MKVKTKERKEVTLKLNEREAKLLAGLAYLVDWSAQREDIFSFLAELYGVLPYKIDDDEDASSVGYVLTLYDVSEY